jgi:hypothetical protein
MTLQTERTNPRRTSSNPNRPPRPQAGTTTGNPLTLSVNVPLDAQTIRAALSVLPTAVADGEE